MVRTAGREPAALDTTHPHASHEHSRDNLENTERGAPRKWFTPTSGIRCRKRPRRKHEAQLERYLLFAIPVDGGQIDEAVGWVAGPWFTRKEANHGCRRQRP